MQSPSVNANSFFKLKDMRRSIFLQMDYENFKIIMESGLVCKEWHANLSTDLAHKKVGELVQYYQSQQIFPDKRIISLLSYLLFVNSIHLEKAKSLLNLFNSSNISELESIQLPSRELLLWIFKNLPDNRKSLEKLEKVKKLIRLLYIPSQDRKIQDLVEAKILSSTPKIWIDRLPIVLSDITITALAFELANIADLLNKNHSVTHLKEFFSDVNSLIVLKKSILNCSEVCQLPGASHIKPTLRNGGKILEYISKEQIKKTLDSDYLDLISSTNGIFLLQMGLDYDELIKKFPLVEELKIRISNDSIKAIDMAKMSVEDLTHLNNKDFKKKLAEPPLDSSSAQIKISGL